MADVFKHFSDEIRLLNPDLFKEIGIDIARSGSDQAAVTLFALNSAVQEKARGNKYGAKRVKDDGKTFDSQAEYRHWLVLRARKEAGEITDLIHQCKIILLEGFTYQGQKVKQISYTADFVFMENGICHIQDLKSVITAKTESFRIRWRLLQWMYRERDDVVCEIILS